MKVDTCFRRVEWDVSGVSRALPILFSVALATAPLAAQSTPVLQDAEGADSRLVVNPPRGADATAHAVRVEKGPVVDGVLDDAIWSSIDPVSVFVQRDPIDGGVPSERTEMRIAYDADNIYFGFMLYDSDPDAILANNLHRGGQNGWDDHIVIGLDTFNDRRNGYIFEINSLGTQDDAIFTDERIQDWNWDGVYWSEGGRTPEGWTLEVAIPFKTIRFPRADELPMGLLIYRSIRRKNESVFWPHLPATYSGRYAQASQYGTLVGIEGVTPGRNVQIKPYVMGAGQSTYADIQMERVLDAGLDLKYAPTSSLTLDLTYNTDFAQVEADNVQVNLDRFSLFFPEKREFFLERSGLFAFGDAGTTQLFFSRRIGLTNPILGGGRLTGQVGKFTIGLLDLQTRQEAEFRGANNAVARLRADLGPRSSVGGIVTNLQNAGEWSRSAGFDTQLRFFGSSSFDAWVGKVWEPAVATQPVAEVGGTAAGAATLNLRTARYGAELGYTNIGESFQPALGFVRRRDQVRWNGQLSFTPRFESSPWARQLNFYLRGIEIDGQDGIRQSAERTADGFLVFDNGNGAGATLMNRFERLEIPFAIQSDVVIPPGDYSFTNFRMTGRINPSRPLNANGNIATGQFYGGTRTEFGTSVGMTFSRHLNMTAGVNHNRIDLPVENGEFSTTVLDLNVKAAVNRDLFANVLLQYDDVSREIQSNVRINWIHKPGSNLYLVFNSGYIAGDLLDARDTRWTQRTGIAKLTYLVSL